LGTPKFPFVFNDLAAATNRAFLATNALAKADAFPYIECTGNGKPLKTFLRKTKKVVDRLPEPYYNRFIKTEERKIDYDEGCKGSELHSRAGTGYP
jgi:hypothetical protein